MSLRTLLTLSITLSSTLLAGCNCNGTTYDPSQVAPLADDFGKYLSMDVAPGGRPVIAYYNVSQGAVGFAVGTVTHDGGVLWAHERVDGFADAGGLDTGNLGQYTAMKVAKDGSVWLAYQAGDALKVAHRVDGAWTTEQADVGASGSQCGRWNSLALDADDSPVIAHYDEGKGNLRVARRAGGSWTSSNVWNGEDFTPPPDANGQTATRPANVGKFADLSIVNGIEYITAYDAAAQRLVLLEGPAGSYAQSIVYQDPGSEVGLWPSLWTDGMAVAISFEDRSRGQLMFAERTSPTGAFNVSPIDTAPRVGADSELLYTEAGFQVLYFDTENNDMKRARALNESWITESIGGEDGAVGFFNEAAAADGRYFAASYDYTHRTVFFRELDA